ncbi:MAG TPA: glycosyltransferase family 2 protein [Flavobacteriales bacterium]|nr:glycosyltransferase family 2 protein [Flavobacteriales bacterium]
MKLSVIIVNYNVRAYLEQCLRTVEEALKDIEGDVFVVDNQSTDGSVDMVREKFPSVRLIANAENVGFSRANNQAIRASSADYVVLLNPDTVVGEDVFRKVITFMDTHPKAGGLGVKMIDGTGNFLPESKRGLPTPAVAFYKIIGLTRLFPHSRTFGRYHLGHLPENEAAPIEILSGACMFLRKKTLDEVGLLDESFFMYGEDIDLSYRITLGGYENWYFPDARIIHYKGESTKKSSVNYVFVFYNAMAIFAQKHFTRRRTDLLGLLINGSIYLSAAGAIVMRFLRRALLPTLDVLFFLLANVVTDTFSPWLGLFLLASFGVCGAYDLPTRLLNVFKGSVLAALLVFGFLCAQRGGDGWFNDPMWFAQLSGIVGMLFLLVGFASRSLLHIVRVKPYSLRSMDRRRVLSIGSHSENRHALALLWQTHFGLGRQKEMSAAEAMAPDAVKVIRKKIRKHGIDEVLFCARDLSWGRIIELMEGMRRSRVMFKIAQPAREFVIGPNSIESINDLFIMERHAVHSAAGRRSKRLMDLCIAAVLGLSLPLAILLVRDRGRFLRNWWDVLLGRKSWVGYGPMVEGPLKLPAIKPGILPPTIPGGANDPVSVRRANITYAKDYTAWGDLRSVMKGFAMLGRG